MDASAKKQMLISQLMQYFDQDTARLVTLGDSMRMLGLDTNDELTLDRIAAYPEHFAHTRI